MSEVHRLEFDGIVVRPYEPSDEEGWVRCRVLSFLKTPYFDNVEREKERYVRPAIELVAVSDGHVVGLLDVECEDVPGEVCSPHPACSGPAGMIWHLAVHPDWQGRGIGSALLRRAVREARSRGLERLEAWTRDDSTVQRWYERQGFELMDAYWHVYITERAEVRRIAHGDLPDIRPVAVFAHYMGNDPAVLGRFERVHRCHRYDLVLRNALS